MQSYARLRHVDTGSLSLATMTNKGSVSHGTALVASSGVVGEFHMSASS